MPIKISQKTKAQVENLLKENNALVSAYHNNEKVDFAPIVKKVKFAGIVSFDDIKKELASRHVIDKKVKQEKMT